MMQPYLHTCASAVASRAENVEAIRDETAEGDQACSGDASEPKTVFRSAAGFADSVGFSVNETGCNWRPC